MMNTVRQFLAYVVLCIFFIFIFLSGFTPSVFLTKNTFPDFSHYNALRTLSKNEYPIDTRNRRVIIVGDIHGSSEPLHHLLNKLSYTAEFDTLIHAGDVIAKGSHEGSLAVLSYLTSNNITGVRGNHDQKVVEWRSWMEWIRGLEGGEEWLVEVDEQAGMEQLMGDKISDEWVEEELSKNEKWKSKIPKGWKMFKDHYRIARDMSQAQYEYLVSLPVVLHIPSAHTFIVHAGLLPYDPTREQTHRRQPLSHIPSAMSHFRGGTIPKGWGSEKEKDIVHLRLLQELGILHDIPQNTDPWVKQNMRSVTKNNQVTKSSKKGTPWSDIWNAAMGRCAGYGLDVWGDEFSLTNQRREHALPCRPATVIYGHAASRGLDIKRWSIGTDTGCVYGRRLSALVLSPESQSSFGGIDAGGNDQDIQSIPYGDDGRGQIVSIKCH